MDKINIVLITTDQMRRDCVGAYGHEFVETPTLDMMKKNGVMFTRAVSAVPTCIASRAAILTGMSQKSHKRVGYEDGVMWNYENTLPSVLSEAGYHTQCVGKMHVYPPRNLCGFHNVVLHDGYLHKNRNFDSKYGESFDRVDDYLYWLHRELGFDADLIDSGLECNSWVARPFPYEEKYHPTNWCVSESLDFLRRRDTTKPFFLHTSFVRPHSPLDPPKYYFDMYYEQELNEPLMGEWVKEDGEQNGLNIDAKWGKISKKAMHRARAAYYGHISHIDNQIGRLIQGINEHNAKTVYLFTSDHGDMLGDHNFFRKALPYEGSIGVPLIIYDPNNLINIPHNICCDELVELRDIMPTLLDAAKITPPFSVEGKSLLKVLKNGQYIRDYIHGEHVLDEYSNHFIVTKTDKYIWFSQSGREQYFTDQEEKENRILDHDCQDRISFLKSLLIEELLGREEGFTDGKTLFAGCKTTNTLK